MELKPGYKQTEVGVIPEDWDCTQLGKCLLAPPSYGINAPAVPYSDNLPVYIRITDISEDGRFKPDKLVSVRSELAANYYLGEGDIVFARTGASVGKSYLYDTGDGPLVYAGFLIRVRPEKERLRPAFAAAYVTTDAYWRWVRLMSMRSGQPGINGREYAQLPIPLPSTSEQSAIAEILTDLDTLLSSLKLLINKKTNIKQAAMQELLTGKRRLPGFEGEWAQVSLGSVAAMNSGGTPPTGRDDFYGGGIPWVSISDMTSSGRFISETERTLSDLGLANCSAKRFPSGSILYAMYASLGECSIAAREVTTSQAILGIRPGSSLVGEYLYYWLESIRGAVKLMGQQGTQSNLNKKIVQGFSLGLPSKAEQAAIAKVLSEIDQDIDTLKVKAEKTRAMKAGMLQKLLTGKIRLK